MDGVALIFFLLGGFLGGLISGLFGFAMGIVVSSVWLHLISPLENTILIIGCTMVTQIYGLWKLRGALQWRLAWPFIVGGAIGVPLGTLLLTHVHPEALRAGVGALLVLYSVYSLARPTLRPVAAGPVADTSIGVLNGLLGGLTGLVGIILVIWCQMRGWSKDTTRTIFQLVVLIIATVAAMSLTAAGAMTVAVGKLYVMALPMMLAGTWAGFRLYGRLDEVAFRKAVLGFLLLSGAMLIVGGVN